MAEPLRFLDPTTAITGGGGETALDLWRWAMRQRRGGTHAPIVRPQSPAARPTASFCVHTTERPTSRDVLNVDSWEFWVWGSRAIDATLGAQKTIALSRLAGLARKSSFEGLKKAVDEELTRVES